MAILRRFMLDAIHCNASFNLDDFTKVHEILHEICRKLDLSVLKGAHYKFPGKGITIAFILAESHIVYSSWPEFNAFAIDIHSCGKIPPKKACSYILRAFGVTKYHCRTAVRNFK